MSELYTHISQRAMQDAAERFEQRKAARIVEAKKKLQERAGENRVN